MSIPVEVMNQLTGEERVVALKALADAGAEAAKWSNIGTAIIFTAFAVCGCIAFVYYCKYVRR